VAGWTAVSGWDEWQAVTEIMAQWSDGFQAHVTGTLGGPLIVLFEQQGADEADLHTDTRPGLIGDLSPLRAGRPRHRPRRRCGAAPFRHELSPTSRIRGFLKGPFLIYQ
jgi:hypothetical protein